MAAPSYSGPSPIVPRCLWIVLYPVQNPEWPSSGTSNFCGPYFIVQTFSWRRCKATEAGYCEILYWNLQTVLQYQNSERLERSASVRRVSRLFSTV